MDSDSNSDQDLLEEVPLDILEIDKFTQATVDISDQVIVVNASLKRSELRQLFDDFLAAKITFSDSATLIEFLSQLKKFLNSNFSNIFLSETDVENLAVACQFERENLDIFCDEFLAPLLSDDEEMQNLLGVNFYKKSVALNLILLKNLATRQAETGILEILAVRIENAILHCRFDFYSVGLLYQEIDQIYHKLPDLVQFLPKHEYFTMRFLAPYQNSNNFFDNLAEISIEDMGVITELLETKKIKKIGAANLKKIENLEKKLDGDLKNLKGKYFSGKNSESQNELNFQNFITSFENSTSEDDISYAEDFRFKFTEIYLEYINSFYYIYKTLQLEKYFSFYPFEKSILNSGNLCNFNHKFWRVYLKDLV